MFHSIPSHRFSQGSRLVRRCAFYSTVFALGLSCSASQAFDNGYRNIPVIGVSMDTEIGAIYENKITGTPPVPSSAAAGAYIASPGIYNPPVVSAADKAAGLANLNNFLSSYVSTSKAHWIRMAFDWASVQHPVVWGTPESPTDAYDWSYYDAVVGAIKSHGLRVLVIFGGPPMWAKITACTDSNYANCQPDPTLMSTFLQAAAQRYSGQTSNNKIDAWEMGNEVNCNWGNWAPHDPALYTQGFVAAYSAIKAHSSSAYVLTGASGGCATVAATSTAYATYDSRDFLLAMFQNGLGKNFDGVAQHPYVEFGQGGINAINGTAPVTWSPWSKMNHDFYSPSCVTSDSRCLSNSVLQSNTGLSLTSIMKNYINPIKPIWPTEFGVGSTSPYSTAEQTNELNAAFVAMADAPLNTYGPFFWNFYEDLEPGTFGANTGTEQYALVDMNGVAKPVLSAFASAGNLAIKAAACTFLCSTAPVGLGW